MGARYYVIEVEISGRRDSRYLSDDRAPWKHVPSSYGGMAGAADRIASAGFPVLFPAKRKLKIDRRTHEPGFFDRPRYIGYILAEFDVHVDGWQQIRGIRGVRSILPDHCETPIPVRQDVIDRLVRKDITRSTLTLDEMLKAQRRREPLAKGDRVNITEGPFSDKPGVVKEDDGKSDRVKVTVAEWLDIYCLREHIVAA